MSEIKDTPEQYSQEHCFYKHSLVEKDIGEVKKDTEEIKTLITSVKKEITQEVKDSGEDINQKIHFFKEKNNSKLDDIDLAFRGNGKIGIFEQIRNLNKQIETLNKRLKQGFWFFISLLIFLTGGSVIGIEKKKIGEFFFGKPKIEKNVGENKEKIEVIIDGKKLHEDMYKKEEKKSP